MTSYGIFEGSTNIGSPRIGGTARYNPATGVYSLTGAGVNMWETRDECLMVWKRLRGNVSLHARLEFEGPGVEKHRKAGLIIRASFDADAPYADAAVHGDGLTSLQFRRETGAVTEQVVSPVSGADVLRLDRRGDICTFHAATGSRASTLVSISQLDLGLDLYVGLFLCSHNPDVVETAHFRDVRIEQG